MLKYSVLVPTHNNDGEEFPPSIIEEFEFEVMLLAGGFTREGIVEGKWMNQTDRKIYTDKNIKYVIAIEEKDLLKLQQIVKIYMKRLGQISYYYEIDQHTEVRVEYTE